MFKIIEEETKKNWPNVCLKAESVTSCVKGKQGEKNQSKLAALGIEPTTSLS